MAKVHLLTVLHRPRLACSPPYVDDAGVVTVEATFILEDVTCGSCRRTKAFKRESELLASRSRVATHD